MKIFTRILLLIILVVLLVPIFLPNRIITVYEKDFDYSTQTLFEEFNNLKNFSEWDAWGNQDSTIHKEYFAPYRGVGAGYTWKLNEKKNGEIIIEQVQKNQKIESKLNGFGFGNDAKMIVEFARIDEGKTKIKWTVEGEPLNYFSRYFAYMNSSKVEAKLEESLNNLETKLQNRKKSTLAKDSKNPIEMLDFEGMKLIVIPNETSLDYNEINTAREESFGLLFSYLTDFLKVNQKDLGQPITYYEFVNTSSKKAKFNCGYHIGESVKLEDGMKLISVPAGKTLSILHKGSYENLQESLNILRKYAKENNLKTNNIYWEVYENDIETVNDPEKLVTRIYLPYK